jgi:hypothetical protein
MIQHAESTPAQIHGSLQPMSTHDSFVLLERRRLEAREPSFLTDNRFNTIDQIEEDHGDGIISDGGRAFISNQKLFGRIRNLNKGTHVCIESFQIPNEITDESIRQLIYRQLDKKRRIGHVAINEPGHELNVFNPIHFQHSMYYVTNEVNQELAVEAIGKYLHDRPSDTEKSEDLANLVNVSRRAVERIQYSDLKSIFEDN